MPAWIRSGLAATAGLRSTRSRHRPAAPSSRRAIPREGVTGPDHVGAGCRRRGRRRAGRAGVAGRGRDRRCRRGRSWRAVVGAAWAVVGERGRGGCHDEQQGGGADELAGRHLGHREPGQPWGAHTAQACGGLEQDAGGQDQPGGPGQDRDGPEGEGAVIGGGDGGAEVLEGRDGRGDRVRAEGQQDHGSPMRIATMSRVASRPTRRARVFIRRLLLRRGSRRPRRGR